jgi:hypothetical protein
MCYRIYLLLGPILLYICYSLTQGVNKLWILQLVDGLFCTPVLTHWNLCRISAGSVKRKALRQWYFKQKTWGEHKET